MLSPLWLLLLILPCAEYPGYDPVSDRARFPPPEQCQALMRFACERRDYLRATSWFAHTPDDRFDLCSEADRWDRFADALVPLAWTGEDAEEACLADHLDRLRDLVGDSVYYSGDLLSLMPGR